MVVVVVVVVVVVLSLLCGRKARARGLGGRGAAGQRRSIMIYMHSRAGSIYTPGAYSTKTGLLPPARGTYAPRAARLNAAAGRSRISESNPGLSSHNPPNAGASIAQRSLAQRYPPFAPIEDPDSCL